jgi:methionine synthase II (cobalamin-independent)
MDNKQLRTAMVQVALSNTSWDSEPTMTAEEIRKHTFESMERIYQWRESVGLNMSVAARGSTEGLWYVDWLRDPISPWADLVACGVVPVEYVYSLKKPNKCLIFGVDGTLATFLYKKDNPDAHICFPNTQPLWNFEQFIRDFEIDAEGENYMDIDYSVVELEEIGTGDAVGFDFIQMRIEDVETDLEILQNCVNALNSGGVLLVLAANNSGKLYRDDFFFHPNNRMHQVLKSNNGYTYHSSENYGHTTFVKH